MRIIGQTIIRALAALLMAFAIASPAIAEIGCSVDAASHAVVEAEAHASDAGDSHQDDDESGDEQDHCAFSHGHCGSLASAAGAQDAPDYQPASFVSLSRISFVSLSPSGPDRPPRS